MQIQKIYRWKDICTSTFVFLFLFMGLEHSTPRNLCMKGNVVFLMVMVVGKRANDHDEGTLGLNVYPNILLCSPLFCRQSPCWHLKEGSREGLLAVRGADNQVVEAR